MTSRRDFELFRVKKIKPLCVGMRSSTYVTAFASPDFLKFKAYAGSHVCGFSPETIEGCRAS